MTAGVRPAAEDPGRGGRVVLGGRSLPLSFTSQWFEHQDPARGPLPFTPIARPGRVDDPFADPPDVCPPAEIAVTREAVAGALKVPGLRNVSSPGRTCTTAAWPHSCRWWTSTSAAATSTS